MTGRNVVRNKWTKGNERGQETEIEMTGQKVTRKNKKIFQ